MFAITMTVAQLLEEDHNDPGHQSLWVSPRPATRSLTSSVCSTLTALTALSTWLATRVIKVRSVSL